MKRGTIEPESRRPAWLIVTTAVVLSFASTIPFFEIDDLWIGVDYETFFAASRLPTFDLYAGPPFQFIYPPTAIAFTRLLGLAQFWTGFIILSICSLTAFAMTVRRASNWPTAALSLLSFPAFQCVAWGQTSMLLGAGLIAALQSTGFRRGVIIGVLASIKPQLFLAAPFLFMARREIPTLAGTVMGGLFSMFVSVALYGPQLWIDWIFALPDFQLSVIQWIPEASVSPVSYALNNGWPVFPFAVASIAFSAWIIMRARTIDDPLFLASVIAGTSILCSPYAVTHDCVILIPAAVTLVLRARPSISQFPAILIFAALALPISMPLMLAAVAFSRGKHEPVPAQSRHVRRQPSQTHC